MIHRITDNSLTDHSSWRHDGEVLIRVENVSKKFCRNLRKSLWYGVQDIAAELNPFLRKRRLPGNGSALSVASCPSPITSDRAFDPNRKEPSTSNSSLRDGEFWALNNASFELRRGECLGLIGRNGAGKTTLLKMLNGLIKPDHGRIEMRGRVGALIALGAGFNPLLTGRENIYVNASVLGLTKKEIDEKMDEIVDFSDISDFIDSPVQSYSSGMHVRLGFSIATAIEPDVLLLDEVLAVGDAAFRNKCYRRIGTLRKKAALIFVSHSMPQVSRICSSVLFLKGGQVEWLGDVRSGIVKYADEHSGSTAEHIHVIQPPARTGELALTPITIKCGEFITIRLTVDLDAPLPDCSLRLTIFNPEGVAIAEWSGKHAGVRLDMATGANVIELRLGPLHLRRGSYDLGVIFNDSTGVYPLFWSLRQHRVIVSGEHVGSCDYQIPHAGVSVTSLQNAASAQ